MKPDHLQQHFLSTYFNLRIGIAVIALCFPFILWVGGTIQQIGIQDSMSAYYHATNDGRSMRDLFVGILFAIGVFLYLYKGYSTKENVLLNMAGIFAIGIALFPMEWGCGDECKKVSVHGVSAISLFVSIALVSIFCASDTLHYLKNEKLEARFRRGYYTLGVCMVLSPLAAFLLAVVFRKLQGYTFIAEATGIAVFAIYWAVKSLELSKSKIERMEAYNAAKA